MSQSKGSKNLKNKKFIFFDIDGTLLNDEKMPLESTVQALRQLQKNGHEIAIATGRNLFLGPRGHRYVPIGQLHRLQTAQQVTSSMN